MTTDIIDEDQTFPTPAWASSTYGPEAGSHQGHLTVGPVTLGITQAIHFTGEPQQMHVYIPEVADFFLHGAQACRDLAAALIAAADLIDNAEHA